jgi:hypothetical protein
MGKQQLLIYERYADIRAHYWSGLLCPNLVLKHYIRPVMSQRANYFVNNAQAEGRYTGLSVCS